MFYSYSPKQLAVVSDEQRGSLWGKGISRTIPERQVEAEDCTHKSRPWSHEKKKINQTRKIWHVMRFNLY